jgi:hypothetical protein
MSVLRGRRIGDTPPSFHSEKDARLQRGLRRFAKVFGQMLEKKTNPLAD